MNELRLPDTTANGRARARALDPQLRPDATPTSIVSFLSHGRVLIVGDEADAKAAAQRLADGLVPTLVAPADAGPTTGTVDGLTIVRGGQPQLAGSLGSYQLIFADDDGDDAPSAVTMLARARFDLVLDLGESPLLAQEVTPPGYYAPRGDAEALGRAIEELPQMRGEFEKPKYFNFDPEICAHGRRGLEGCTRCLEVCPAWAISSSGDHVTVDPNLCQGFGSCASVCPTGAIKYAFPDTGDLLGYLRDVLGHYRDAGGTEAVLIFFDRESAASLEGQLAGMLPENALPVELEEIGSVGLDVWFTCLAYGACSVLLLTGAHTPESVATMLAREVNVCAAILEGMGFPATAVQAIDSNDADAVAATLREPPGIDLERPARFVPPPEKGLLQKLAISHLLANAPGGRKVAALPAGAPFGQVKVNRDACTLCMSCVAVCPTSALHSSSGLPQLNFVESSCIQCGLCETACPEDAVSLEPRFLFDDEQRSAWRLLHEEQPACCISCGKPFATRSMLKVMAKKLEDHWMFQTDAERRRLEMCEDCRVRDMMRSERTT